METNELIAKVLDLVSDALLAGKDGRRKNPIIYINRIKQLLHDELPEEKKWTKN